MLAAYARPWLVFARRRLRHGSLYDFLQGPGCRDEAHRLAAPTSGVAPLMAAAIQRCMTLTRFLAWVAPARGRHMTRSRATLPVPVHASGHWQVIGVRDSTEFFRALDSLVPEATTLVLEGSSVAKDVRAALRPHLEAEYTIVPAGKGWPDWRHALRLRYSRELLTLLAALSERHAEPELCDHLHIFRLAEPLLSWHDAFDDPILVSDSVPELRARLFAARFGAPLAHHDHAV